MSLPLLIFDIDGVLVDVSASYRAAIAETVRYYLVDCLGLPFGDAPVTPDDIAAFKAMGGFNNDWDLTAGLLRCFLARLPPGAPLRAPPATLEDILQDLAAAGRHLGLPAAGSSPIRDLVAPVRGAGGGLAGLIAVIGPRNAHLLFYDGDLHSRNLVLRLFQEIYLGPDLFQRLYGSSPRFQRSAGLIDRETALTGPATLAHLARETRLAFASGRPAAEASYALQRLGLAAYFETGITHDDVMTAEARLAPHVALSLGKPHPWPLLAAAARLDPAASRRAAYIGDTVDDIRAARRANVIRPFLAVGCSAPGGAVLAEQLAAAGADVVIPRVESLAGLAG